MSVIGPLAPPEQSQRASHLRSLAQKIEAQFVAEMLKSSGLGDASDVMGGGLGEDQFSSFLTEAYSDAAVRAGGIGLSEAIYNALIQQETGT